MSRGKSAGLFTGEGDNRRGVVIEDRHDEHFGIMLIHPTHHSVECHLKTYPSKRIMERFLYDLAWVLDCEVIPESAHKRRFERERELEKKLKDARKELRELKKL